MRQSEGVLVFKGNHYVWCANEDHAAFLVRNGFTRIGHRNKKDIQQLMAQGFRVQYQF